MTLRLKNGQFASAAKARKQRNKWFHRALISASASLRKAGFGGEYVDNGINARIIELSEPIYDYEQIIEIAQDIVSAKRYPDVIYNISFRDSNGRWFAATHAWESVELAAREIVKRIRELMLRYERASERTNPDSEYAIEAVEVSVYPWRK